MDEKVENYIDPVIDPILEKKIQFIKNNLLKIDENFIL